MLHAAPHRSCFCLKPCKKALSSKDSGPASLPFCLLLLARIWTSVFHWQCFGTAWLKVLSLIESLLNAPCCTPSKLLLPQALQKGSEFKGFRPSITAILSSAACTDPDISLPLAMFWHSLAESSRIDSPGFDESCKSHVVSMGNATRTN